MDTEPVVGFNHTRKIWQLVFLVVPALIGSVGSYLKSRAEATDQSIASFKTCTDGLLHLQEDSKANRDEILMLKGRMLACESRSDRDELGEVSSDDNYVVTATLPVPSFFADAGVPTTPLKVDTGIVDSGSTAWVAEVPKLTPLPAPAPIIESHKALDLPANLDEAVERYKSKK